MIEHVKALFETLAKHQIIVSYQGAISNEMVMQMGEIIEQKQSLSGKMKRLFSIFLELSQNIMRYSDEKGFVEDSKEPTGVGMVAVLEVEDRYLISAANLIAAERETFVKDQFDYLNTLSKDELKALFLQRRKEPAPEGSKGAGLGLIDITRKSSEKIEYMFWPNPLNVSQRYVLILASVEKV